MLRKLATYLEISLTQLAAFTLCIQQRSQPQVKISPKAENNRNYSTRQLLSARLNKYSSRCYKVNVFESLFLVFVYLIESKILTSQKL